jgi:hypothetical protein
MGKDQLKGPKAYLSREKVLEEDLRTRFGCTFGGQLSRVDF